MTKFRRLLVAVAGSLLAIPLITVALAPFMMVLLEPEPVPVSPQDLPPRFPVLGVWRDASGSHCRAFIHAELANGANQAPPLSFAISSADRVVCSRSFEAFNATGAWPNSPPWAFSDPGPGRPAHFELKSLGAEAVEVRVGYFQDGEGPNEGWYEVRSDSSELHNTRYQHYFGLAVGFGVILLPR